ncbi:hypothetical protein ACR30T_03310 [Neisseria gonorrhoeae]
MIASNAKNRAQNPSAAYRPALFGQTLILPPSRTLVQTGTDDTARAFPVFHRLSVVRIVQQHHQRITLFGRQQAEI